MPISPLPLDDKPTYLIESKALTQIAAVGLLPDLLHRKPDAAKSQLLVVGDIDYDVTTARDGAKNDSPSKSDLVVFQKLPRSNQAIAKLYKRQYPNGVVRELTEGNAAESQVRQAIPGSSMIYFNTHGFSVPLSILQGATQATSPSNQFDFDPLVSGIALAGANHAMSVNEGADGILWASEIAMLNLEGTELVTLSACETALGDLIPGEGMQGSQRAPTIAAPKPPWHLFGRWQLHRPILSWIGFTRTFGPRNRRKPSHCDKQCGICFETMIGQRVARFQAVLDIDALHGSGAVGYFRAIVRETAAPAERLNSPFGIGISEKEAAPRHSLKSVQERPQMRTRA